MSIAGMICMEEDGKLRRDGRAISADEMRRALGASVPGDEVGEQPESCAMALLGMELHGKDIRPGNGASKRQRIVRRRGGHRRIGRVRVVAVREVEALLRLDA